MSMTTLMYTLLVCWIGIIAIYKPSVASRACTDEQAYSEHIHVLDVCRSCPRHLSESRIYHSKSLSGSDFRLASTCVSNDHAVYMCVPKYEYNLAELKGLQEAQLPKNNHMF